MKRKVLTSSAAVNPMDLFTEALERQERIAHRAPVLVMSASFTDEFQRPEDAARYAGLGARFLNYGMDIQMIAQHFSEIVREVASAAQKASRVG